MVVDNMAKDCRKLGGSVITRGQDREMFLESLQHHHRGIVLVGSSLTREVENILEQYRMGSEPSRNLLSLSSRAS